PRSGHGDLRLPHRPGGAHEREQARPGSAGDRESALSSGGDRDRGDQPCADRRGEPAPGVRTRADRDPGASCPVRRDDPRRADLGWRIRGCGSPSPRPGADMTIRVLVADDEEMVRDGFRMILEGHQDITVVGEAEDGLSAVEAATRLTPDVVLMDIRM